MICPYCRATVTHDEFEEHTEFCKWAHGNLRIDCETMRQQVYEQHHKDLRNMKIADEMHYRETDTYPFQWRPRNE